MRNFKANLAIGALHKLHKDISVHYGTLAGIRRDIRDEWDKAPDKTTRRELTETMGEVVEALENIEAMERAIGRSLEHLRIVRAA